MSGTFFILALGCLTVFLQKTGSIFGQFILEREQTQLKFLFHL